MKISFTSMGPEDSNAIVTFLSTNNFPFHVRREWTEVELTGVVDGGRYWNNESQGFWIIGDGECLGMAVLEDLEDDTPMFDLRLAGTYRGLGLGVLVLKELTDKVFNDHPETLRFEGQTREDNLAMRKTFVKAGFLKEAHYRMSWPADDGTRMASVAYAILRQDWESGETTRFDWNDLQV
ncbi:MULTISPECIES: GNAT family protein [Micrococcaceae]|uniref:GNAT family N-acetyltransferase n=1 Tax=Micrococcaceae TaxID=1268 RepID=UPI001035B31B|nr:MULTISPECIES: GNAT family protein [Micrococcaceae]TAP25785.1 N-acetyltransferase [Arthrobacter sp. S41]UXN31720.1 GNAT family N-acetyltransferase [Glutamicibacter sp. M10]